MPRAIIGDATIHEQAIAADSGLLGDLFDGDSEPITRSAPNLQREDYPHIDARRTVRSVSYIPLIHGEDLIGAVEVLCFRRRSDARRDRNARRDFGTGRSRTGFRAAVRNRTQRFAELHHAPHAALRSREGFLLDAGDAGASAACHDEISGNLELRSCEHLALASRRISRVDASGGARPDRLQGASDPGGRGNHRQALERRRKRLHIRRRGCSARRAQSRSRNRPRSHTARRCSDGSRIAGRLRRGHQQKRRRSSSTTTTFSS